LALESTWLFHEIGRCYLELGSSDKAKEYGEKSLSEAKKAEDDVWQLNATVLIAQAEVKLEEFAAAASSFESALETAKLQGDEDAEVAICKALDDVKSKLAETAAAEQTTEEETPAESEPEQTAEPAEPPTPKAEELILY
jgi:tetratricopeptide (TPR) repeat protein